MHQKCSLSFHLANSYLKIQCKCRAYKDDICKKQSKQSNPAYDQFGSTRFMLQTEGRGGGGGKSALVQLVCNSPWMVQPELGVEVVQLAGATQEKTPHYGLCVRPSLQA